MAFVVRSPLFLNNHSVTDAYALILRILFYASLLFSTLSLALSLAPFLLISFLRSLPHAISIALKSGLACKRKIAQKYLQHVCVAYVSSFKVQGIPS